MGLLGEGGSVPPQKIAGRLRPDFPEAQYDFLVRSISDYEVRQRSVAATTRLSRF